MASGFSQNADDLFQFNLPFPEPSLDWVAEVLEVGGGEDQHLARTVVAEVIVALLVFDRLASTSGSPASLLGSG